MKKVIVGLILGSLLLMPMIATATILESCTVYHDLSTYKGATGAPCPSSGGSTDGACCVLELVSRVGDWIFAGVMILAVVFIVIGAYYFVTAAGSPEKVTSAKNYMLYALIGFAVAVLARGMTIFVKGFIGG